MEESVEPTSPSASSNSGASPIYPDRLTVYEYTPAPGQFIGDVTTGGMAEPILTPEQACSWAEERMNKGLFVSLGAFGGYIVVGIGGEVSNVKGADFAIGGNAFFNSGSTTGGSNEPGIVYVMEDSNHNGLPDDEWFELRGSDYYAAGAMRNYEITYFRPDAPEMPVKWKDSLGREGEIDYIEMMHRQPYYWPAWLPGDSYTFKGSLIPARTHLSDSGRWDCDPYEWGYADNIGSDIVSGMQGQWVAFDLDNAVDGNGKGVHIEKIHFVKVQTGVNAKAGLAVGEVSTEVTGFKILNEK